jgi:tRNA A37 threonylcarbamoyladenosine modification protein TsaB
LQAVLAELPSDQSLSSIIVGTGPGSYNGARVGIAAAQAIAQVHSCGVAGLCTFEGVPLAREHKIAWAVGDARRGSFFVMPIINGRVTSAPELLGETEFLDQLATCEGPKVTFESPGRLPGKDEILETSSMAKNLVKVWLARTPEEQQFLQNIPVEAFYLRPPHITKSKKNQ